MGKLATFVEQTSSAEWRLGNEAFEMVLQRGAQGTPSLARWVNRAQPDQDWASHATIAPGLVVGDAAPGEGSKQMPCAGVEAEPGEGRLCLRFEAGSGLILRHYLKPSSHEAVVVSWTTLENTTASEVTGVSRLDALNLALSTSGQQPWVAYLLGWLWGPRSEAPGRPTEPHAYPSWIPRLLYGDGAPAPPPPPEGGWASSILRLIKEPLATLPLRSGKRSTYENHPWCVVRDERRGGGCFLGLEWSGTWEMDLQYELDAEAVTVRAAAAGDTHCLPPHGQLASPLAFIGLFTGEWDDAFNACRRYVRDEVLPPVDRTFPLVQDNVGIADGTNPIDRIHREIGLAHEAGFELVTVDAQWWAGSSEAREFSWGLGSFTDDRTKFPEGLRAISDRVHALGMKFGLWFEFSRVDLRTANRGHHPWSPEMLLHQQGQSYRSWCQHVYMMCTGAAGAADWALENMAWCVREFDLDYIKIDDNEWAVCDDTTHGHGVGDGEWSQIQGVYSILRGLRERFPHIVIENCAGGSQRADLGMGRYCVPIQVHDRCFPSILERRYAHGIGCIYPQYAPLLALMPAPETVEQLRWRTFSRMMGGFCSGIQDRLSPEVLEEMKQCVATYKRLRPTLHGDRYVLAEPAVVLEPDVPEATNWEAYEYLSPERDLISVFFFRCNSPDDTLCARLRGLEADASYFVTGHGAGEVGTVTGTELMKEGLRCRLDGRCQAEIYLLRQVSAP